MKSYLDSPVENQQLKISFLKDLWAGDSIGQLSNTTRGGPLLNVREAVVDLTPAAIEKFVLQTEDRIEITLRALESTDLWGQVLNRLNSHSLGLADQQKAKLVVDFTKQFSRFGRFDLGEDDSRLAIDTVLDGLESRNFLKTLLPEIRRQSKSASVTLMQYFVDRHEAALQNNQSDGLLAAQELERFSRLLGMTQHIKTGLLPERSRLAAARIQNNFRPVWASPAVFAAALTGGQVGPIVENLRFSRDQRVQQLQGRLDSSQALQDRIQRLRLN
jgi:hypothetical protein